MHLLRHVGVFDHGLSVTHGYLEGEARARGEELGCRLRLRGANSPSPLLPPPTPLLRKRGPRGPNSGRSPAGDVTRQRSPPESPQSLTEKQGATNCNGLLGEGLATLTPGRSYGRYRSRGASKEPHTSRRRLVPRPRPAPAGPAPKDRPHWLDAAPGTLPLVHAVNGSLRIFLQHFVADHNASVAASVAPAMGRTR